MGSMLPDLFDAFAQEGITVRAGESETRTQDPDAPFAYASCGGTLISTGAGIALAEVMLLERLLETQGGNCLVIGNGFGWSAVALALMLKGKGRVVAMDACLEGTQADRGFRLVKAIAAHRGLPLEAVEGLSPRDLPRVVERLDGRLDIVLVDGLHTDEQQLLDYEGIRPYLAPGALVIFHDVLNWRMEASFEEIARRDGRGAAVLHRTPSGLGVLHALDAPFLPFLEVFRGEARTAVPGHLWETRYGYLVGLYASQGNAAVSGKYLALGLAATDRPERVWMGMGRYHFARKEFGKCLECAREAERLHPGLADPVFLEALVLRSQGGAPGEVWNLFLKASQREDPSPALLLDAGFAAFDAGLDDRVRALLPVILERMPDQAAPRHLEALLARRGGATSREMWPRLSEALRRQSPSPGLVLDAAFAAYDEGLAEEALALARRASLMQPGWAPPLHLEALLLRQAGAPPAGILRALCEALSGEGVTAELLLDAGFAIYDEGRLGEARALADRAAALKPEWAGPLHLRSLIARKGGASCAELWTVLSEALTKEGGSAPLHFDAAMIAQALDDLDRAEALARKAVAMAPDWKDAQVLLVRILRRKKTGLRP